MDERAKAVAALYRLLGELEALVGQRRRLSDCTGASGWPAAGVYFFFEDGEVRTDGTTPRVVRVGTHGLRSSRSTLWRRLSQHRGTVGGNRPGGGNHRGSIFRLHVGEAILNRDGGHDAARGTWGVGSNATAAIRATENDLELAVSAVIGAMHVLWLPIDDPPSADSARGVVEAGAISLLSNLGSDIVDPSSPTWLGRYANRPEIVDSGMWNVRHVRDAPSTRVLEAINAWIDELPETGRPH
jgi:hypothetical protein